VGRSLAELAGVAAAAEIAGEERSKEINPVIFKRGGSLSRPSTI
jgi:hypothetical protein